ncbi:MAG: hypothetical protein ACK5OX_07645 [Desertimonas sp.]
MTRDDDFHQPRTRSGETWGGRAWTLIAAVVVVLAIAAGGVWLAFSGGDGEGSTDTTAAPPTPTPGSAAGGGVELPPGFVGGREVVGGVPMGFSHDEIGAVSAAATWTAYVFVCPQPERAEGAAMVLGPDAPPVDPCNPVMPDSTSITGLSPFGVRGDVAGDTAVLEVLAASSGDFTAGWEVTMEIVTITLAWDPSAEDWRITTWSRRDLFDDAAPAITPDTFAGFQWIRPAGFSLTATRLVQPTG